MKSFVTNVSGFDACVCVCVCVCDGSQISEYFSVIPSVCVAGTLASLSPTGTPVASVGSLKVGF